MILIRNVNIFSFQFSCNSQIYLNANQLQGIIHGNCRNYSRSKKNSLYILSAVRTPFGLHNGSLHKFTAPQLGSFALTEALHRAVVPIEDLQNIFLGCALNEDYHKEIIRRSGLSKAVKVGLVSTCGMEGLIEAAKLLDTKSQSVCLAGGTESLSNSSFINSQRILDLIKNNQEVAKNVLRSHFKNSKDLNKFIEQDYKNFIQATKNGAFCDEIIKIAFRKRGELILITEDDISRMGEKSTVKGNFNAEYTPAPGDGAAALITANEEYVQKNHLTPLAQIVSFAEESSVSASDMPLAQLHAVKKALEVAGYDNEDIARWEIDSIVSDVVLNCISHLNLNISSVNKDGGFLSLGYPFGMSGVRALCHLIHSLPAGEVGCAAKCDFNGTASALIIQKLSDKASEKPLLTLYTKKSCLLCEDLKEKLELFKGEFLLQEIDIEAEENKKFRKLYKYEIPVLFLDGRFLCKHELDVPHFRRRLLKSSNFGTNAWKL